MNRYPRNAIESIFPPLGNRSSPNIERRRFKEIFPLSLAGGLYGKAGIHYNQLNIKINSMDAAGRRKDGGKQGRH
ncbi:MAG: hypothetical protein WCZ16_06690, partial [Desulfosarcinaceae bacterium]